MFCQTERLLVPVHPGFNNARPTLVCPIMFAVLFSIYSMVTSSVLDMI